MFGAKAVNIWSIINVIQNKTLNYRNKIEIIHDKCLILRANRVVSM